MCGILGVMFFPTQRKVKNRLWAAQHVLAEAFAESKERGKDAAGAAMIAGDYYAVVKGPWVSDEFMLKDKEEPITSAVLDEEITKPFEAFTQICRKKENELSTIMMHTRAKTQGSEYDNKNNHPILVPNEEDKDAIIIGVHNGVIKNDDLIRKELGKEKALVTDADVDSAAIFEVIHNALDDEEPDLDFMDEIAKWIEGQFAVCAVSRHHPHRVMFWRDGRPLEYIIAKDLGMVFFASDDKFLKAAISRYNRQKTLFKQRLSLPEIEFESRIHIDDWSVLFDTSIKLGDFGDKKSGIEQYAQARKTEQKIYETVQLPVSTTTNHWGNRSSYNYQTEKEIKEKAAVYVDKIANTIEKDPVRNKDANIYDLSPEVKDFPSDKETIESIVLTEEDTKVQVPAIDNSTGGDSDDDIIEGEIITKTASDDCPESSEQDEDNVGSVTEDVYDAAQEELDSMIDSESTIASLDEVIERCATESQLQEYTNSLEAIRDLYAAIFEEAFVAGVAWRERMGIEEAEEDLEAIKKNHTKLTDKFVELSEWSVAMEENRDKIKETLDKEMAKKIRAQNYVFALRITLKAIIETVLERTTNKNRKIVAEQIHKALTENKIVSDEQWADIVQLVSPEAVSKKNCKMLAPLARIDVFLKSLGAHMKISNHIKTSKR